MISLAAVAAVGAGIWWADVFTGHQATAPPTAVAQVAPAPPPPPPPPPPPAAPAPPSFPAKASYVAKFPARTGTITLEITVAGDRAVAYACDGHAVEAWMRGTAGSGALALTSKDGANRLVGRLRGTSVSGTVWIGANNWDFTAKVIDPPAGLYVYDANGVRSSWIVDAKGAVTGVERHADGSTSAAPQLSGAGVTVVDGRTVTATRVEDGDGIA